MARHNTCVNPSLGNDNATWGGNGSAPVRTAVTGFARPWAARYTDGTIVRTAYGTATPGLDYTLSADVRLATFALSGTMFIEWQDASHGALSYTGAAFSISAGVVTRISVTGTAPANTVYAAAIIGNESFNINTCDVSECLVEPVGTLGTYFDGDSPSASWDGTPGSSSSTLNDEQTVALGRATETDTGQALTASKTAALARAADTETARTLALAKTLLLGRATETDSARTLAASDVIALSRASETSTARALTVSKTLALGRAIETGTARRLTVTGGVSTTIQRLGGTLIASSLGGALVDTSMGGNLVEEG
jgi:hypothetical protein